MTQRGLNRIRRLELLFLVAGTICVGVYLGVLGERTFLQWQYRRILEVEIPKRSEVVNVPREGPIGSIEIPRLDISAAILDGTDATTLRRAVGHVRGTSYPGEATGRIALAAHRDSFFQNLRGLKQGDRIRLVTAAGVQEFLASETAIVKPDRIDVIAPTKGSVLTLITCYPFDFVGSAPERFVVNALPVNVR